MKRSRKITHAQAVTVRALAATNDGGPWGPYRRAAEELAEEKRRLEALRAERAAVAAAKYESPWQRERGRTSPKEK